MKIIKGINKIKYLNDLISLHRLSFKSDLVEAHYDFKKVINLRESYLMINENNNDIVSFLGVSIKKVKTKQGIKRIALIGCVMTNVLYQKQGYAKQLLKLAEKHLIAKYDSVIIQAWNWDIYKSFDLENTTIKYEYQLNLDDLAISVNNHDSKPTLKKIKSIENSSFDNKNNVIRSKKQIRESIKLHRFYECKFLSNNSAYIWFKNNRLVTYFYNDPKDLIELIKQAKIKEPFLMFESDYLNPYLINNHKSIVVTKTFTNSKIKINNINIFDFVM